MVGVVVSTACGGSAAAPATSHPTHQSSWQVIVTPDVISRSACGITSVALDAQSNLYLSEHCNDRIQKFSPGGSLIATWGGSGSGPGQLNTPAKLTLDMWGNLYVTEIGNNRVQKFSPGGTSLAQWGTFGSAPGQFNYPVGIAVDKQGNIFVSDLKNDRIQKLSSLGQPLAQWGSAGSGPGQFAVAYDIAFDANGNIYVSDPTPPWGPGNDRIQKFSPTGEPLAQWGGRGSGPGKFNQPTGLAVDKKGNVFVLDSGNNRVQKISPTGQYLAEWKGPEAGFRLHSDMAMDAQGNIYATLQDRIVKLVVA
jgi:streptogramin lyase